MFISLGGRQSVKVVGHVAVLLCEANRGLNFLLLLAHSPSRFGFYQNDNAVWNGIKGFAGVSPIDHLKMLHAVCTLAHTMSAQGRSNNAYPPVFWQTPVLQPKATQVWQFAERLYDYLIFHAIRPCV
jgi:hypothetical protein